MTSLVMSAALLTKIAQDAKPAIVDALVDPLNAQMGPAGVDSPLRAAHFLAQACYESAYFTRLSENLSYSASRIVEVWPALKSRADSLAYNPEALGNAVYANRFGNGDEASGDGYAFRGRGLFQHTFRDNYSELQSALDLPLLTEPDLLCDPSNAVKAALYFFKSRGCLELADQDDINAVTRKVNGGTAGIADRAILKHRALALLTP